MQNNRLLTMAEALACLPALLQEQNLGTSDLIRTTIEVPDMV